MNYIPETSVYKMEYVKNSIIEAIEKKKPFSLVRFGDAEHKFIYSMLRDSEKKLLKGILKRQGIRANDTKHILKMFKLSGNTADFISSFECWLQPRHQKLIAFRFPTFELVEVWEDNYKRLGIKNKNYCDPNIGFFLFLHEFSPHLFDTLKSCNLCLITSEKFAGLWKKFKGFSSVTQILIPPEWGGSKDQRKRIHSDRYLEIVNKIPKEKGMVYLIGAGFASKIYAYHIKKNGGIALDVGKMIDYWATESFIPLRMQKIVRPRTEFYVGLTEVGEKFKEFI